MKNIASLLFLLLPFALYCDTNDSSRINKFTLGVTYSPDYCFRTLKPDASSKWLSNIKDTIEIPNYGYTTGANIIYNLNDRVSLASGLFFSDIGFRTKKLLTGNSGSGKLPTNNTFIYHYQYLDIPLKINYTILNKKYKLYLTTGVSTNVFLSQKTTTIIGYSYRESEKEKSFSKSDFAKVNFAFLAGFGIDCQMNDKFNFRMEPIYRRSINSIIDAPIKSYLYSFGINIGIYFKIK